MNQFIALATACLLFVVLAQGSSCHASNTNAANTSTNMKPTNSNDRLANGVWGGQHVRAEVTEAGVQLEFDCAHGVITQAIRLDSHGKFDVPGKFGTEHAGPVLRDEESNDRAVRYTGQVDQEQMTLTISDAGTKESFGTFELKHGSEGRLMKCR